MSITCGFSACKYNSATKPGTDGTCTCDKEVNLRYVDLESVLDSCTDSRECEKVEKELKGSCALVCDTYKFNGSKFSS